MEIELGVEYFRGLLGKLYQLSRSTTGTLTLEDLEQVKEYWQKLLGIDVNSFQDDLYNDLTLTILWIGEGIEYHGLKKMEGPEPGELTPNLRRSMGNPLQSEAIVQQLDSLDSDDSTDLSQKLSLSNKMRAVLDSHGEVVRSISARNDLVNNINTLYINDMYYRDKGDQSFAGLGDSNLQSQLSQIHISGPLSSDPDFNELYIYGFTKLLASLEGTDTRRIQMMKIRRAAESMVKEYSTKQRITFLYNLDVVNGFHRQIWKIAKFCFRDNVDAGDMEGIIENYSVLNPVLPILKPLLRQLLDEEDAGGETRYSALSSTIQTIKLIPAKKLVSLIEGVISLQKNPIPSLVHFGKLIQCYVEVLEANGNSIEDDYYYGRVSRAASSWIGKETSIIGLYSDLYSLSLVPHSGQRSIEGHVVPSEELREAYLKSIQSIRLERKYLLLWSSVFTEERLYDSKIASIKRITRQPYFNMWKIESDKSASNVKLAVNFYDSHLISHYFLIWKQCYDQLRQLDDKADKFSLNTWFKKWSMHQEHIDQRLSEKEHQFNMVHSVRQCLTLMALNYKASNSALVTIVDDVIAKLYLERWRQRVVECRELELKALKFHDNSVQRLMIVRWKLESSDHFRLLCVLNCAQRKFTLGRYMALWTQQAEYSIAEGKVKLTNWRLRRAYFFNFWQTAYKLNELADKMRQKHNMRVAGRFLTRWKRGCELCQTADRFSERKLTTALLKRWRFKWRYVEASANGNAILAKQVFRVWRLTTRYQEYQNSFDTHLASGLLDVWRQRSNRCTADMDEALQIDRFFTRSGFLRFWRKQTEVTIEQKRKAVEFRKKLVRAESVRLLDRTWKRWERIYLKAKHHEEKLEEVYYRQLLRGAVSKAFISWQQKYGKIVQATEAADSVREGSLMMKYMLQWLGEYDRAQKLEEIYQNQLSMKDVELLRSVVSQMSLKMMKYHTDYRNADLFKVRWQKNALKAFFDIWKIRLDSRHENEEADEVMLAPSSNPYIDFSGYSSPYAERASRLGSLRSSSTSDLTLIPSTTTTSISSPPRLFRTPHRTSMTISSSAKKARRLNLEQRVNHYKQAKQRSPEKLAEAEASFGEDSASTPTRASSRINAAFQSRGLQSRTPLIRKSSFLK
ncbi:DEKNAAC102585 [Brettanomyces naardenensis]|uniref:DEKNAAC102585 n=1 Tax=Brettanomyces naardenensis TaxID=13370 RepID=A0A448YL46_BRENA|nr:DEKNAAC102585 [Brettanomyces naardenensis]